MKQNMKKIILIFICICLVSCFKKEVKNPYHSKSYNNIQEAEVDARNGNPYAQNHLLHYYKRKHIKSYIDCSNEIRIKIEGGGEKSEGCIYKNIKQPPKIEDLKKAIYWSQKYSCNPYGRPDAWLGYIYEGDADSYCIEKCNRTYDLPEVIGLLPKNLSMAYAHYYFAFKKPFATNKAIERLEQKMTNEEIAKAKNIIEQFKNKECPHDNTLSN